MSEDVAAFAAIRFFCVSNPVIAICVSGEKGCKTPNAGLELGMRISLAYLAEAIELLIYVAGRASVISLFTAIVIHLLDGMLGAIVPERTWFGVLISIIGVAVLECSESPPSVRKGTLLD
ncbi:hypothetical protein SAY86_022238 [Trapa natans]|uniref:EamA domain-containing protein n=1 Tax=Trapa natans TaxID=22666 RepID=A0AAN7RKY2_TRANT|nr:hypothetical protein SAY86_022238 [Trapa natans]